MSEKNEFNTIETLDEEDVNYLTRLDNLNILQIILSKRIVLVEGPTEYILMERMIKIITNKTAEEHGIHILSMGGDHAKRFLNFGKVIKQRMLIVTDNDSDQERINWATAENTNEFVHISMPDNLEHFTFEVALYFQNQNALEFESNGLFKSSTKDAWKQHESLDKKLIYVLDRKVSSALRYENLLGESLEVPTYIKEGIEWLIE